VFSGQRLAGFGSANIADLDQTIQKICVLSLEDNPSIMGVWRQIAEYFYLKKRDPNAPHTQWMKYMHGINRISIFMFLLGLILIIIRLLFFKRH